MMLTARIKSCAAAVCVLAGCLLLPNAQAKQSPFPCRNVPKLFRRSPRPRQKSAQAETAIVTPLALETVALPVKEEAVTEEPLAEEASVTEEAPEEAAEETPAPEADNAIARATKADHERPDDLVKLGTSSPPPTASPARPRPARRRPSAGRWPSIPTSSPTARRSGFTWRTARSRAISSPRTRAPTC